MANGGNMYFNCTRGQNGNDSNSNLALGDVWEFNNSRFDWNNSNTLYSTTTVAASVAAATSTSETTINSCPGGSSANALMLHHHGSAAAADHHHHHRQPSLYAGDGSHVHPDPHLMCLKLGKRHYFEDATALGDRHVDACSIGKRGKVFYYSGGGGGECASSAVRLLPAAVPRCQVEGCHVALVNAKDYHRRHKVCEMHSKAPKVVVSGLEQRFCQQCSRFHAVSEFDDSKRSCRRRLAGHNERRRKSSHDSIPRNSSQDNRLMAGRLPYLSLPAGCALSLLSSRTDYWVSPADLSSRSSAALRELIAEHRAAILARQLILDRDMHMHHHSMEDFTDAPTGSVSFAPHRHQALPEAHGWDRFHDGGVQVTLDLMQAPSSAFGFLPVRGRTKEEENECCELWNALEGAHVV